MILTRDLYPPFRVDLTELFSRHLTEAFDLVWVMARAAPGPGEAIDKAREQFWVSGRSNRGGWRGRGLNGVRWLGLQMRMAAKVVRGEYAAVQVRDAALSALLFFLAARIGRTPFVYWMSFPILQSYEARGRAAGGLYGAAGSCLLHRLVLPLADHVFVQSERMKADLQAQGVRARMTAIPMGVSTSVYNPRLIAPVEDRRLNGRTVLLYQGAFEPERDLDFLPAMLRRVVGAGIDAVLVIVGGGRREDAERLFAHAEAEGVSARLIFTGHLPLAAALAYVRRADICLAPYPTRPDHYLSATPTKLVEYLAMGRPVIATPHPDQSAVIEASGAGVIAAPDADAFAAAALRLLKRPDAAAAMAARGPAWVAANRDYADLARRVEAVYRGLFAAR